MLRNRKTIIAAVIGLLLAVLLILPSVTLKGKGAVRSAMAPAERASSGFWHRLSEASAAIRGIGGTVERSRQLSLELVRVQAELSQLRDAETDNARLRRAFDFRRQAPFSVVPCDVVSRNISGWWHTVRIGKGTSDGIEAGRAVISPDGLVGKTIEPGPLTTEVLLLSDPACRVSAKIARCDVFGLVRGAGTDLRGHPRAIMEFINKDAEIKVGDEVVTSGLSGIGGPFPKGVHIGYIDRVHRDDSGLYQHAELVPRATIGLLDYLFVVQSGGKEVAP